MGTIVWNAGIFAKKKNKVFLIPSFPKQTKIGDICKVKNQAKMKRGLKAVKKI